MGELRDAVAELGDTSPLVVRLLLAVGVLVLAVVVRRVAARVLRRAYWRRIEARSADVRDVVALSRVKRQRTLVTLLESLVRYGVYGAALVAVVAVISPGSIGTYFSAGLVVVLLGFGFQRLLGDVIAGALLLFEGHFAVGDVITAHTHNVTGVVEDFSLRTTTLRTFGGDRVTLLNGSIAAFTRFAYGQRELRIEVHGGGDGARGELEAACAAESAIEGGAWVRPPAPAEGVGGDGVVVLRAMVAPGHDEVAGAFAQRLRRRLGLEEGDVLVLPLDDAAFDTWRAGLLVRG